MYDVVILEFSVIGRVRARVHKGWTPSGPTGDGRCFFILKKDGDGGMI